MMNHRRKVSFEQASAYPPPPNTNDSHGNSGSGGESGGEGSGDNFGSNSGDNSGDNSDGNPKDKGTQNGPSRWMVLRVVKIALVILVLLVLGVLIYRYLNRPPSLAADRVRRETIERILAVTGLVTAEEMVRVIPMVSGKLTHLNYSEGDSVEQGAVLGEIDDADVQARLAQVNAQLQAQREELAYARQQANRVEELYQQGAVSRTARDEARLRADTAQSATRQLEAQLAQTEVAARDYVLTSPIDGVILNRLVDEGQSVTPQSVVYEIAGGAQRTIESGIDERFLNELKVGMEAVVAPTGSKDQYPAAVVYIDRRINPETGTARVDFILDDDGVDFILGLSVDVNVSVERHEEALTVARAAVGNIGQDPHVLMVVDGVAERRPVEVIDWPSPRIVATDGLTEGDLVLLDPTLTVPGRRVRPVVETDDSL